MSNITRRSFLKTTIALSSLPFALEAANNSESEVLKFIHVTDTHLDLDDENTIEAMKLMVNFINENYKDLDFVLFGGDNFNNMAPKNSDALVFKNIIDKLYCPSYAVRGNKESSPKLDKSLNLEEFQALFCSAKELEVHSKDWLLSVKGYNFLGLDSCIEGANNGVYAQETLEYAEKILQEGKPTIILNHHPYTNFWKETNENLIHNYVLNNTDAVQKKLFSYDNLILTLSGHKHVDSVKEIQKTKVIATRGFVRPLDLDMYPMRYIELNGNTINEKLIYTS